MLWPRDFSAAVLGFEPVLPVQSSGFTKSNRGEKENYWREQGKVGKERESLRRGHKSAGEQKEWVGVGPGLLTWWPCL